MLHNNKGFHNAYLPMNNYEIHDGDNNQLVGNYPFKLQHGSINFFTQPNTAFGPIYQQTQGIYDETFKSFCHIPDVVPHQTLAPPLTMTREMPSCSARKIGMKRKASDVGLYSLLPAKIKIDEAKMAAYMSDLNLHSSNNNYINNSENNDEMPWFSTEEQCQTGMNASSSELSLSFDLLSDSQRNLMDLLKGGATLEVKDEFKVNFTSNEILPKSVVEEIVKPGLQLVLWKPPGDGVLGEIKRNLELYNQEKEDGVDNMMTEDVPFNEDIPYNEDILMEDIDMDP